MPTYLIERNIPGASKLSPQQLDEISRKSQQVVKDIPGYTWHHSYVAGDKFYCVHSAASEADVRTHAERGGFPVDAITPIAATVGPEGSKDHTPA